MAGNVQLKGGPTAGKARGSGGDRRGSVRRTVLLATAAVAVAGIAIGTIVALRSGENAHAAAGAAPGTGATVPAGAAPVLSRDALTAAADALEFRQTTSSDVGVLENLPAQTVLLPPSATLLPVGRQAPDFTLASPTGDRVRLSDYQGKTVLLEFFATWCPHCQAEAPHLIKLFAGLPAGRFAFLSVNADSEDAASIYAFDRYFSIPWPSLLDPGTPAGSYKQAGGAGAVTDTYGVALYPTFYVIDPKGRIAWRNDREQPDALLLQRLIDASGT